MDIVLHNDAPSAASATPSTPCSARPTAVGWARSPRRPRPPRRPRRPRGARPAASAAPGAPRRAGARRLDQPRRAQLHLPAAHDPAGRGLRRGDVLRAVLARAAAAGRGARLHRRRLHGGRREQLCAELEARIGPKGGHHGSNGAGPGEDRSGSRARAWGCARWRRWRWSPSPARSRARSPSRHADGRRHREHARRRRRAAQPAARGPAGRATPGCGCCAASAWSTRTSVDSYRAHGGYEALRAAFDMGRTGVLREVTDAKLLGRGGAAFPTGRKWEAVARTRRRARTTSSATPTSPSPGTFKDRVLLEHDPFSVVEAMTIAGFATGCEHGYLYLRGEYPLAWERLVDADHRGARAAASSATTSSASGISFDIELRKGAGAYICGEETALFNSIEGYRGEPRNKPPFPVEHGLFDKPTVINNVETLVNVPGIVLDGGAGLRADRHRGLDGHAPVLPLGPRRAARALRGAVRHHPARAARHGRRRDRRPPAADDPARRRRRPLRHARRARHRDVLRGDPRGRREHGLGRRHGRRRHRRPAGDPACASPRSSATSRAGSACRAASGPCARRRRSRASTNGHPRGTQEQEYALLDEITASMRDASICGLGQTAADAIESALRKLDVFETGGQR